MELNKIIVLQKINASAGYGGRGSIAVSANCYAYVEEPSLSFKAALSAGGISVSLIVHLWRHEWVKQHYTHAVIDGVLYRIENAGSSVNDNFVKLVLVRS